MKNYLSLLLILVVLGGCGESRTDMIQRYINVTSEIIDKDRVIITCLQNGDHKTANILIDETNHLKDSANQISKTLNQ